MRKVKWEPKVTRNEKPKEKGQGYLELLMFSQKMKGEKNLHNGLREKL